MQPAAGISPHAGGQPNGWNWVGGTGPGGLTREDAVVSGLQLEALRSIDDQNISTEKRAQFFSRHQIQVSRYPAAKSTRMKQIIARNSDTDKPASCLFQKTSLRRCSSRVSRDSSLHPPDSALRSVISDSSRCMVSSSLECCELTGDLGRVNQKMRADTASITHHASIGIPNVVSMIAPTASRAASSARRLAKDFRDMHAYYCPSRLLSRLERTSPGTTELRKTSPGPRTMRGKHRE